MMVVEVVSVLGSGAALNQRLRGALLIDGWTPSWLRISAAGGGRLRDGCSAH